MSIKIDLDRIVNGPDNQTNFTTELLRLLMETDPKHRTSLARDFPNAVEAVKHYQETGEILDLPTD